MDNSQGQSRCLRWTGICLAGLAMSVGWGFRGDYGHEAGAMVPGALLALAICLASGREDWWRRASIMALCGAIGWAFGGQMSYGRVIGYTAASSFIDVAYGYASLFLIGALWAGIGAAFLATSVTQPRSYLERFAGPLVALWIVWLALDLSGLTDRYSGRQYLHDTDWIAATSALVVAGGYALFFPKGRSACALIATLAAGWWAGYLLLTVVFGLRMTPPRSDNWSGCVGLFVALLIYLRCRRDRAALRLAAFGFLAGGVGFALGDFLQMLGRAQWGPIGTIEALQGLDYWKWMEQSFGLIMGLGLGAAFLGRPRAKLAPPVEDRPPGYLNTIAAVFLLVVMIWLNLRKNVENWTKGEHIPADFFPIDVNWWFLFVGLLLAAAVAVAVIRHRQSPLALVPATPLGRAQILFLFILWIAIAGAFAQALPRLANKGIFFVHTTFWITGALCSLILVSLPFRAGGQTDLTTPPDDRSWRVKIGYWIACLLVPLLLIALAHLTITSHAEPLSGGHLRFSAEQQQ
jgi:hypothetical protein